MSTKKTTTKPATKTQAKAARKAPTKKAEPQAAETKVATTADAKPAKVKKLAKEKVPGKLSALDAAAKVLVEAKEPMNAKSLIEAMAAKQYWTSPGGQTPAATLYSALIREIAKKGKDARFVKVDRGEFGLNNGQAAKSAKKRSGEKTKGEAGAAEVSDGK